METKTVSAEAYEQMKQAYINEKKLNMQLSAIAKQKGKKVKATPIKTLEENTRKAILWGAEKGFGIAVKLTDADYVRKTDGVSVKSKIVEFENGKKLQVTAGTFFSYRQ